MADAALRVAPPRPAAPAATPIRIETDKLTAMYGKFTAVKSVSLGFPANRVHALIGPSGCGKSTFLRTLNRMHELVEGGWITGRVLLDGEDIYAPRVNAMQLRRRIGMVFQKPTPFPTMSICLVCRSWTKMSLNPLPSPATKFDAKEAKATKRPSALMLGPELNPPWD